MGQRFSSQALLLACRYCILGDGCNMEGISNEACSLAGHWGLGKLIALYDDNKISIDGHTEISFTEDVSARFEALGWHVQHVEVSSSVQKVATGKQPSFYNMMRYQVCCTTCTCSWRVYLGSTQMLAQLLQCGLATFSCST